MKTLMIGAAILALVAGSATAQPYGRGGDHNRGGDQGRAQQSNNGRHAGWGAERGANHRWVRGQRMGYNDWRNARPVDYRQHRLRAPPRGYEWRESNGQYVLAAVATGVIISMILGARR